MKGAAWDIIRGALVWGVETLLLAAVATTGYAALTNPDNVTVIVNAALCLLTFLVTVAAFGFIGGEIDGKL